MTDDQRKKYRAEIPGVREQESMAPHTSFKIGGPARLFVVASSSLELEKAVCAALEIGIPWYVFGGGSNLLVADQGFDGVMIQVTNRGVSVEGELIKIESGALTALVARKSAEVGLGGLEWAASIPGTIGGAIYGNAGCYGGEMKDAVQSVEVFHVRDRTRVTLSNHTCAFAYRESIFKREPHVILSAVLSLPRAGDPAKSMAKIEEIIGRRKASQPLGDFSAGCAFKNFEFEDVSELDRLRNEVEVPEAMLANKTVSAGWLIDQAGLLGQPMGGVAVSEKHGNFILNKGRGKAEEVIALISCIKRKIRDDFGIELQEELQYVGFS